ncbi:hypothetical protein C1645_851208, partial [Glomus cerebriforme]
KIARWIEDNWKRLVISIVFLIVLLIISGWKKNIDFFYCGIAISKFVTSILFASGDSKTVDNIFFTSVFFTIAPFVVNLGFVFLIMIHEFTKDPRVGVDNGTESQPEKDGEYDLPNHVSPNQVPPSLSKWIKDGGRCRKAGLVMFALLAGIDIENLNFLKKLNNLNSNLFEEKENEKYFKIGSLFNTVIEDISNIVIQENAKKLVASSSVEGTVSLTQNGTDHFLRLNNVGRKQFYTDLITELAEAIPAKKDRLDTNFRYMYDASKDPKQIILSINVKHDMTSALAALEGSSDSLNGTSIVDLLDKISVDSIVNNLNIMIRNKTVTVLANGEISQYLDSGYGYQKTRKNS